MVNNKGLRNPVESVSNGKIAVTYFEMMFAKQRIRVCIDAGESMDKVTADINQARYESYTAGTLCLRLQRKKSKVYSVEIVENKQDDKIIASR